MNGLQGIEGYELFILTFGLSPGTPEFRHIQSNFAWMAESSGSKGLVITGAYDKEFGANFAGFFDELDDKIFGLSRHVQEVNKLKIFPVPALVAIKRTEAGDTELAYFCILGVSESEIVSLFRRIHSSQNTGGLEDIEGNLLGKKNGNISQRVWRAIQIRPSFFGLGIDVKELLKRI